MKNLIKIASLSTSLVLAGTFGASASLLDFTKDAAYDVQGPFVASGKIAGIEWTLVPNKKRLTYTKPGPSGPTSTVPLAGENDGVGISTDEVTAPREALTLTFSKRVELSALYVLDLFIDAPDQENSKESVIVTPPGSPTGEFFAVENFTIGGNGFGAFDLLVSGKSFTFTAGTDNDDVGKPDFALAGVEISPIPLPAGILLMGTALGGLGIARRRRKA